MAMIAIIIVSSKIHKALSVPFLRVSREPSSFCNTSLGKTLYKFKIGILEKMKKCK